MEIYHKYKDQGLEVVCISFEKATAVNAWKRIVERDNLDWINVSNRVAFDCPIYKEYIMSGFANQFILDRDGRIALRFPDNDKELEAKIKELL